MTGVVHSVRRVREQSTDLNSTTHIHSFPILSVIDMMLILFT